MSGGGYGSGGADDHYPNYYQYGQYSGHGPAQSGNQRQQQNPRSYHQEQGPDQPYPQQHYQAQQHPYQHQQQQQQYYGSQQQPYYSGHASTSHQPYQQQAYVPPPHQASPDLSANLGNILHNPTAQMGIQALSIGQEYVHKNMFRPYFDVDHSFVLGKLLIILFPFRHKNWSRMMLSQPRESTTPHPVVFRSPREDVNAPDLYIPVMSVVSYVLLYGLVLGTRNEFRPDRLYYCAIKALTILAFELVMLKLGGFVLSISQDFSLFDFIAVLGYGFVGVIGVLVGGLLLGRTGRLVALLYTSISTFFFSMLNQRKRRIYFLFGAAALQTFMSFLLIY